MRLSFEGFNYIFSYIYSDNDLESTTEQVIKQVNADMSLKASVFIGMDTRYGRVLIPNIYYVNLFQRCPFIFVCR